MSTRIVLRIERRRAFAEGVAFGETGAYERLDGTVHFAVDPLAPAQSDVVDLDKAPRNAEGLVEFDADLCILRPAQPTAGNRRLLFGYGNRGNKRELQFFNDAPPSNDPLSLADAGNGFLMRRGYSVVWAGWQGDLLPGNGRLCLRAPIASRGGEPIVGVHRVEFIADRAGIVCFPLSGQVSALSYPAACTDPSSASLTRRRYTDSARHEVAPGQWSFARLEGGEGLDAQGATVAVLDSNQHIYLPAGFEPGWIYELVYQATAPRVMGLGHVAVRDLVSLLKHETHDHEGEANPLGVIEKAYAWGRSQTGRCIRDFVYQGFNADAAGRRVFDGVMPHVAGGGLMWMNHRFAAVNATAGQEYEEHLSPADRFPFSYARSVDHLSGRADAILKRPESDPLVLHTQSSTEYWQRRGSLVHTDTRGNDLEQPPNARVYLWSSSQHFAAPNLTRPSRGGAGQQLENVVATSPLFRALLDALDRWATDGVEPPPSRVPLTAHGTLVDALDWRRQFPAIPGVMVPRAPNRCPRMDFGEQSAGLVTRQPPEVEGEYVVRVPAVNADGNDLAGIRMPVVQVPLGTYTGWNIRARGLGHGAMYQFSGSYIPLPDSPEERLATGDPRTSVLERYATPAEYVRLVEAAARELVAERLLLAEDVDSLVEAARDWGRPLHDVRL